MSVEAARAYAERSLLYLSNAAESFREQHPEKSSEFLWGALAEALKAVAALKDIRLRTHTEIRRYAHDVAKETDNERLLDIHSIAEALHSNFYEGMFDAGLVLHHSTAIRKAVTGLLDLIPPNPASGETKRAAV